MKFQLSLNIGITLSSTKETKNRPGSTGRDYDRTVGIPCCVGNQIENKHQESAVEG
jgi:hypothetical protein